MIPDRILNLHPILALIILLAASYLLSLTVRWLFFRILKYYAKKDDYIIVEALQNRLKGTVFLFIPLIILYITIPALALPEELIFTVRKFIQVLIIASATVVAMRLINVAQDVLFYRFDTADEDNLRARQARTQIIFLKKLAILIVVVLAVAIVLLSFEGVRQYGATLLTSAGVAGIIIGFAAQKTIANLLAGFQIAFTQPIKIEDAVIIEGEWGWIEEINLTYVVVKIWDLRRLVVPITYFTEKPFQNWTRSSAQLLGSVFLYTDYTLPLDALRKKFDEVLDNSPLWDREGKSVQVTDSSERTMTVRLLMTAKNSPTAWELRCYVREQMITWIQENYPASLPRTRAEIEEFPEIKSVRKVDQRPS
jgi:small-conductance mechanosensitive channel